MIRIGLVALCLLFLPSFAAAGKYNKTLSIGDQAPEWKELEGTGGKKYSLADFKDHDALVIVFTCNTCPYAVDYEDRLIALAKKLAADGKGAVIAINANKVKDDLLPAMQERAEKKGFNFPYLHDATQEVARAYGATYTPEFVVLNKDRQVVYLGAMDDNTDATKVEKRYVEQALAAIAQGKAPDVTETPAVGCAVRYERTRRKK